MSPNPASLLPPLCGHLVTQGGDGSRDASCCGRVAPKLEQNQDRCSVAPARRRDGVSRAHVIGRPHLIDTTARPLAARSAAPDAPLEIKHLGLRTEPEP
jgi:hypothetical protein